VGGVQRRAIDLRDGQGIAVRVDAERDNYEVLAGRKITVVFADPNGKEVANGFSELNDPDDQRARFMAQVRAKAVGAAETMDFDEDYCRALEVGLPPTAGEGVGIDRLAMLLTGQSSIRDVILFPLMRSLARTE